MTLYKKPFLLSFILFVLSSTTQSQISHSNYSIGYDRGVLNATNYLFEHRSIDNTSEFESISFKDIRMPTSAVTFQAQAIESYMIVSSGLKLRLDHEDEEDERISGKFGDLFWIDASVGGELNDVMGLYVGGQWKQAGYRASQTGDLSDYRTLGNTGGGPGQEGRYQRNFFGRTERGLNGNLLLNLVDNQLILRFKYEYNWLKMRGIPGNTGYQFFDFRGRNQIYNAELLTYFSTDEDRDYGLAFSVQYLNGFLESGYQEGFEKEDFIPGTAFNQIQFSVRFLFAGRGIDSGL